jgi:TolB protein
MATVIFVQSNGQTHSLGIATSTGQSITNDLHRYAAAPAWSPNGAAIAFFGEPGIGELGEVYRQGEGIWTIDPQGGNPRQLVNTDHVKNIAWSSDGSMLAYEFWQPDRSFHEVIIIDAGDGRLLHQFAGEQPAWNPGSQSLIIKACNPGCGLWQVDLDGKTGQQITFHKTDSFPALSPDGQALSFASQRSGDWEIYRLELTSNELLRLTNRPGSDTTPVFSPDGQEIHLRTDAFGGWRITALSLDGSNERLIKEGVGPSDEWGLARPAVY